MTRDQLLRKIDTAWAAFQASYDGLSETQLVEKGVTGNWSVKDIIAHVSTWELEALTHLPEILSGQRPERYSVRYGGIDQFNRMMTEKMEALPFAAVAERQEDAHARLVAYIEKLPAEQFTTDTRVRRRIRLDCYGHYPIHTKAIIEWRIGRFGG